MNRTTLSTATASLAITTLALLGPVNTTVHAAKPPATIQVITTIEDSDPLGRPYLVSGDGAPYVTTSDGLVSSTVSGGQWMLSTYALGTGKVPIKRSNRTGSFQFSEPVGTNAPPADLNGIVRAQLHMLSKCDAYLATMSPGTVQDCAGAFRLEPVNDNDIGYRLAFQPENYAEVTRMRVTCTAGSAGYCTNWIVTPGASAAGVTYTGLDGLPRSVNQLLLLVGTSEDVAQTLGDYYLSFTIRISR